jgi:hypothetical protein
MNIITAFVPTSFIEVVKDRLERIVRRATRLDLPVPVLSLGTREMRVVCRNGNHAHDASCPRAEWVEVTLTGEPVRFKGWRLVASVDNVEGLPVFRSVPGEDVPVRYREMNPAACEHCGVSRFRTETFIVGNEDGRYMQAGSTCVRDFIGWDVSAVAAYYEDIGNIIDDPDTLGSYAVVAFRPEDIIRAASSVVSVDGKYHRSSEQESSTKGKVVEMLLPTASNASLREYYGTEPQQAERIYDATLAALPTLDLSGDWAYNLTTTMKAERVEMRHVGIIASAVVLGLRAIEDAATGNGGEYIAPVGEKVTVTGTMNDFRRIDGAYGTSYLITLADDNGNIVKWFASNPGTSMQALGRRFTMTGTVKKHDEYRGVKSTVLTRCKMVAA